MQPDKWEVNVNEDGSFEVRRQGQLLHRSIPRKWLEAELGKYGFCGQEYRGIRLQLQQSGRAVMETDKGTPPPMRSRSRKSRRQN